MDELKKLRRRLLVATILFIAGTYIAMILFGDSDLIGLLVLLGMLIFGWYYFKYTKLFFSKKKK